MLKFAKPSSSGREAWLTPPTSCCGSGLAEGHLRLQTAAEHDQWRRVIEIAQAYRR